MAALNTVKREENGIISDVALAQVRSAIRPLTRRSGFLPCAVLFFLAPLVGEVLAGSTPLDILGSPASFLTLLLLEALLYGGGAVLIRDITRRTGRGWPAILGLGLAYGVLEEGLITQSFFNPDFLGLHLLGLGSLLGLGWVWITDLVPLHAVWSIGVPIALAELLFRDRGTEAWLGRLGLTLASALFAVGVLGMWLATYASERTFVAPWPKLLGALAVVVVITQLALRLTRRSAGAGSAAVARAPSAWLVGVSSFTAASLFMGVHQLYSAFPNLPGAVPVAVTVAVAAAMIGLVLHWSRKHGWGPVHHLALAAGALFTYAWTGFFTISLGDRLDLAGQVVADGLAVALVVVLAVQMSRNRSTAVSSPLKVLPDRQGTLYPPRIESLNCRL